jgi:hypothetical protein
VAAKTGGPFEHTTATGGVHLAMPLLRHRDIEMKPGASKCRGAKPCGLWPATTIEAMPVEAGRIKEIGWRTCGRVLVSELPFPAEKSLARRRATPASPEEKNGPP